MNSSGHRALKNAAIKKGKTRSARERNGGSVVEAIRFDAFYKSEDTGDRIENESRLVLVDYFIIMSKRFIISNLVETIKDADGAFHNL